MMFRTLCSSVVVLGLLCGLPAAPANAGGPMRILSAEPDVGAELLRVVGKNIPATPVFAFLAGAPASVVSQVGDDLEIELPANLAAGSYRLVLSRHNSLGRNPRATLSVAIGTAGPAGPQGEPGEPGAALLASCDWISNTETSNQVDVGCPVDTVVVSGHCAALNGGTLELSGASGSLIFGGPGAVGFTCTNNTDPQFLITAVALCCPTE